MLDLHGKLMRLKVQEAADGEFRRLQEAAALEEYTNVASALEFAISKAAYMERRSNMQMDQSRITIVPRQVVDMERFRKNMEGAASSGAQAAGSLQFHDQVPMWIASGATAVLQVADSSFSAKMKKKMQTQVFKPCSRSTDDTDAAGNWKR